ncbi:mannose-1-phosphate guanylyltransferase [Halogranum amylolyticum]|uniref:Mannose-1-phosphate guanylyltransferase n=1 Tax=Halogranum amylolyticum TaxID=660520 RepID=A0A1H8QQZ9_9EURY|nr:sugar phosphate nucleotidyltransferase [Halogranum amylolyticum]SEO56448.1 mannose-1-phosphate guanylyltransferase [Halogranum amylolyticum]
MDRPLVALVLAGGTGTRLYPASRADRPKQFLSLVGDDSLLAETADRVDFADRTFVSTRPAFADEISDHAPDADVLTEPVAKDTGPALVYATHRIREEVGDCVVLVVPSDHTVSDLGSGDEAAAGGGHFESVAQTGARVAAETGALVTFGVDPSRAETGYGYVEPGEGRSLDGETYFDLAAFHEKPDAETAAEYVDAGYYWNAGIFAWTPESLLAAARDSPLAPLVDALETDDGSRGFDDVPEVSIDYAVMERADHAAVVPAAFEWDDLGSWDALERVLEADADGNVALGDALTVDAEDNVVASDDKHVSLVGVSELAVVAWDDRVLVIPKEDAQRVREVVSRLKAEGRF